MNEKPLHLPMGFGEALERLACVPRPKSKTPEKPKAPRARATRQKSR